MELPGLAAGRLRLSYLDGLRGLAALFVVLHHAYYNCVWDHPDAVPGPVRLLSDLLLEGHYGVDVFIVLSGYCLMLPLSRSRGALPGGLRRFFVRRARRILPPYYAALALCLAACATIPLLGRPAGTRHDVALPALDGASVLAHLALVHNVSRSWVNKIDPPMWSVATEWQIYFLFALVLVPLWRGRGALAALAVAVAVGCAPHLGTARFDLARFWLAGLFALGMVAAEVNFAPGRWAACRRLPWGPLAVAVAGGGAVALRWRQDFCFAHPLLADYGVGLGTAVVIVACTRAALGHARPLPLALLESRPAVALGRFSYSLYLVHWPVLALLLVGAVRLGVGPRGCLGLLLGAGVPLSLAVAYLFYLAFERPFLRPPS